MSPESLAQEKTELRRWARQQRSALPLAELSQTLILRLAETETFRNARHILLYLAMPDEVNVEGMMPLPEATGKAFYAPRCAPKRRLAIHPYRAGETPLRIGPFGIREPDPDRVAETDPLVLDLILVPALLLSERGDRLGYGGGYYDRLLPHLVPTCARVGLLPEALVLTALPREPWDQPLTQIITESRIIFPAL